MSLRHPVPVRMPEQLHEALVQRAERLGRNVSEVVRDACAREVQRPLDARDASAVSRWLAGEELDGSEEIER
jgi:Arc/MetJ-type ribon-helix-helix transcriptional regulator